MNTRSWLISICGDLRTGALPEWWIERARRWRDGASDRAARRPPALSQTNELGGTADAPILRMTTTTIVTWLILGLIAGGLAGLIAGGYGLLGDIVVGIAGAFIGGYLFQHSDWHSPFTGLAGTIFVAFVGALILLVVLHLAHAVSRRRL
jgi:uncharacterized membrane protein YeaQ/YmgE (transglycosylase-associated protein family)